MVDNVTDIAFDELVEQAAGSGPVWGHESADLDVTLLSWRAGAAKLWRWHARDIHHRMKENCREAAELRARAVRVPFSLRASLRKQRSTGSVPDEDYTVDRIFTRSASIDETAFHGDTL